jgi:hypothetical protein
MEAASSNTLTYTVSISSTTRKVTISPSAGTLSLLFNTQSSSGRVACDLLGFNVGNTSDDYTGSSITSPYPVKLERGVKRSYYFSGDESDEGSGPHYSIILGEGAYLLDAPNTVAYGGMIEPPISYGEDIWAAKSKTGFSTRRLKIGMSGHTNSWDGSNAFNLLSEWHRQQMLLVGFIRAG